MTLHVAPNGPFVIEAASGVNAEVLRQPLAALTGGRSGVIASGDMLVTANGTPNMTVNVAAGTAIINGTEAAAQGSYQTYNDASASVAITASDPVNPRIDLIVVAVQDAQYSGAQNRPILAAIAGTPAGSPVAPTIPVSPYFNALALAQVAVAANATTITSGNITDVRAFLPNHNAQLYGISSITASPPALTTGRFLIQAGSSVTTTDGSGNWTITWPVAFPTGIVTAVVTPGDQAGGLGEVLPSVGSTTKTSVAGRANSTAGVALNTQAIRLNFIAVGW